MNIGVLIYTYNRIDDARISMEIVRNLWGGDSFFSDLRIVHAFNGEDQWYNESYLEDTLVRRENKGHVDGAADLIDAGMEAFYEQYSDTDYVIILAADTWVLNPQYIEDAITQMKNDEQCVASCPWGSQERSNIADVGIATDFLIVDMQWVRSVKLFPLRKNSMTKLMWHVSHPGKTYTLERLFYTRYKQACKRDQKNNMSFQQKKEMNFYAFSEREPVHSHVTKNGDWVRGAHWPEMGLLTHHDPEPKQEILCSKNIQKGKYMKKLHDAQNMNYYNKHV